MVSIAEMPILPPDAPVTEVSAPIASAPEFLSALLTSNFNLPLLATRLTPDQLLEFTSDPKTREKLDSLLSFNNLCISLRQTKARHCALDAMQSLVEEADDPLEKRRAATSLLRATTPAKSAAPSAPDEADDEDAPRPPRPKFSPSADLSPQQVIKSLRLAMYQKNQQEENAGLATIAAFCDDDATLDGETLPTDTPRDCIDALDDTPVKDMQTSLESWNFCERYDQSDATIPVAFACKHKDSPLSLTFQLERRDVSKHPGCWLITALTTGVYRNSS